MKNKKFLVIGSALALILIFFAGTFFYKKYEEKRIGFLADKNFATFVRDFSPQLGDENAKIFVTEFLDPECESCAAFYPYMKQILSQYQGKIKLVVRYAPLHPNSQFAIRILEAARKQGKYWETLAVLFQQQPQWGSHHHPQPEMIWNLLPSVGLDIAKIRQDLNDPVVGQMIEQDIQDAAQLGVRMTPTFFVNGKLVEEFGPSYLVNAIEVELNKTN